MGLLLLWMGGVWWGRSCEGVGWFGYIKYEAFGYGSFFFTCTLTFLTRTLCLRRTLATISQME